MFGFLKNKIKEWVNKAKEKLIPLETPKEAPEEKIEKPKEKKIKVSEKERKIPQKKSKKETIEKVEKIIEEAKKEKTLQIPQEFDVGKEKFEPGLEKIKEEAEKIKETEEPEAKETKEEPKKEILEKEEQPQEQKKPSFFSKIISTFTYKISEKEFKEIFEELELLLLENNVALEVVEDLRKKLSQKLIGKQIKKQDLEDEIKKELKSSLNEIIIDPDNPLDIIKSSKKPFVILFFGINGTGKTTSIAKIAHFLRSSGFSVVLAAADTFRAASIEQLSEHAKKLNIPVIKQDYGADPAAVGFDAIKYAKSHRIDVVLIDTAGRMHTKTNLIEEMKKIEKVTNPDLKLFVAESIAGNDATEQAKTFNRAIQIDGTILSKADVDEKGGTILSVSHATNKPIFYLGTGQNYEDLQLFNKQMFIESLGL